jgi:branched-chain amino acid transport system ATP-binding protein
MADVTPLLVIEDLATGYDDEPVVRDFSMTLRRGGITTIIGPNGAGKSTLLGAIYGLGRRFSGRILFEGEAIEGLAPGKRLTRGIGLVPQGRCNFPLMSVRENLELGTYSLRRGEGAAAIERMVEIFPLLATRLRVLAGNLSGGEQQILEMAMVLATAPRLLLLDEPSLGLSPANQSQVFRTLADICARGVTLLVVEQNASAALAISDWGIVLELGRKFLEGPAAQIMNDPAIRTAYLGAGAREARAPG